MRESIPMTEKKDKQVIYFDDECNLCHFSKDFYLKRIKFDATDFVPAGDSNNLPETIPPEYKSSDGVILFQNGRFYYKSDAVLKLIKQLPGWKFLYYLIYIPKPFRDFIYDLFAKYRYHIFGKRQIPEQNKPE